MPQIGTCFDEYPYVNTEDFPPSVHYPIVVEGIWWLASRVKTIEEIGEMCYIPSDELLYMKLKYGG